MSCSEQPTQSTCVVLKASRLQMRLSGNAAATLLTWSTSAIIRNITKPRYASREVSRTGEGFWALLFIELVVPPSGGSGARSRLTEGTLSRAGAGVGAQ